MASFTIEEMKACLSTAISDYPIAVIKAKKLAGDATYVTKKLAQSTGKAAWYAFTTFLILGLPFMLLHERDAMIELEEEHARKLGFNSSRSH